MSIKAFAYIRVSGKGQLNGSGLDRQLETIQEYTKTQGYELSGIFREEGISGTVEDRPSLGELLEHMESEGVKVVIVERLDRLARDLLVQEVILNNIEKLGFSLISAMEGSDIMSTDPTRRLVRQILGAIAEFDRACIVEKLKVARVRKRKMNASGKCEGRKGYAELNADVVRKVLELRANGSTYAQTADMLNTLGYKTISDKAFTADVVQNIYRAYNNKGVQSE